MDLWLAPGTCLGLQAECVRADPLEKIRGEAKPSGRSFRGVE